MCVSLHSSHCSEPSFGRRVLTATERSRAVARTGRSFHLGNLWPRGYMFFELEIKRIIEFKNKLNILFKMTFFL